MPAIAITGADGETCEQLWYPYLQGAMKLGVRKRGPDIPKLRRELGAEQAIHDIKAHAEAWVAQTHQEFLEARSKLAAEAKAARARRAELEQQLAAAEARITALEQANQALRRRAEEAESRVAQLRAQAISSDPDGEICETKGAGRVVAWAQVRALAAEGHSQREIARRLGLNRRTVARLIAADQPPRYRRQPQGSMLDPLEPVMRSVLSDQPAVDAPRMTEILREHGYRGSVDLVRRRLHALRSPR
jgi:transposase